MNMSEKLCEVIKEALLECDRCPGDSVRDIFNEKLSEWKTGLVMRPGYLIEQNGIEDNAKDDEVSEANPVNPLVETDYETKCCNTHGEYDADLPICPECKSPLDMEIPE